MSHKKTKAVMDRAVRHRRRRPSGVDEKKLAENWARVFGSTESKALREKKDGD